MFKKLPCEEIYEPNFNRLIIIVSKNIIDAYEEYVNKNNQDINIPKVYFDVKLSNDCIDGSMSCFVRRLYNPKEDSTIYCIFDKRVFTDEEYKNKYLKDVDIDFIKYISNYNPDTEYDTGLKFKNHLLVGEAVYIIDTQEIFVVINLNELDNKVFDIKNIKYNKEYFMKRNYRDTLNLFDKVSKLQYEKNILY
jgi:hypothetical protein